MKMTELTNRPRLAYLLKEFVLMRDEQNADISEDALLNEYNWLLENNKLHLLFDLEEMLSIWEKDKAKDRIRTAYFELLRNESRHPVYNS
jgi:hypothetical protein